ncbi:GTP cyclohydrolase 1 [compost metagenome]
MQPREVCPFFKSAARRHEGVASNGVLRHNCPPMAKKSVSTKKRKTQSAKSATEPTSVHLVRAHEILKNVRPTPMIQNGLSPDEKISIITDKFKDIMETLGMDLSDDSLQDTPRRIAKMYVNEVFSGLEPHHFPKITVIDNSMSYDQMIVVQKISCLSFCEHHFLPIDGYATVAYIPNKKVIGLSKINRVVQFFSRRPQVQERLTKQIADCLQYILGTEHVAVHINARHYCVMMRGVEDTNSATATSDLRGHFKSRPETRTEFLEHCFTK